MYCYSIISVVTRIEKIKYIMYTLHKLFPIIFAFKSETITQFFQLSQDT